MPLVVEVESALQVVTNGNSFIRSYDVRTGEQIWQCSGLTDCAAPSPAAANGRVFCATGFRGNAILSIDLGRKEDISDTDAIAWRVNRAAPNVPSPLAYENRLYVFEGYKPILSAFNTELGASYFERERLPRMRQIYASPVAVNGRV